MIRKMSSDHKPSHLPLAATSKDTGSYDLGPLSENEIDSLRQEMRASVQQSRETFAKVKGIGLSA